MSDQTIDRAVRKCSSCAALGPAAWEFCGICGERNTPATSFGATETSMAATMAAGMPALAAETRAPADSGDGPRSLTGAQGGEGVTQGLAAIPLVSPRPAARGAFVSDDFLGSRPQRRGRPPRSAATGRGRRTWLLAAVGALVLVGAVAGVANDLGVRSHLDRTSGQLRATQAKLGRTTTQLADTKAELAAEGSRLASTTKERDALKLERSAQDDELSGVKGSLNDAQARMNLQAGQIETLKSCLNGVSNALGYAADDDYRSAVASLEAVEVSCDKAGDLF